MTNSAGSCGLIRDGSAPNAGALAAALIDRSGLDDLRRVLLSQFADRRDLLKARSGLLAVEAAARARPGPATEAILSELERITAGAHELREMRLLNALRSGAVAPKADDLEDMERLLGTSGPAPAARLGLPAEASEHDVRAAAQAALTKWQRRAESPMASPQTSDAARILMRTCEGILTAPLG